MTKRRHPEQALQMVVVEWLELAAPGLLYFAVPNAIGVKGANRIGGINKAMGVRPGVADLCFVLDANKFWANSNVVFIELKAPGTGHRKSSQSESQQVFQADCARIGAPYAVCDSLEQVEGTLRGWGIELRGSVAA